MGVETAIIVGGLIAAGATAYSGYRAERASKLQMKRESAEVAKSEKSALEQRQSLISSGRRQLGSNYALNKTTSKGLVSSGLANKNDDEVLG